jgi:hypothetical protein
VKIYAEHECGSREGRDATGGCNNPGKTDEGLEAESSIFTFLAGIISTFFGNNIAAFSTLEKPITLAILQVLCLYSVTISLLSCLANAIVARVTIACAEVRGICKSVTLKN